MNPTSQNTVSLLVVRKPPMLELTRLKGHLEPRHPTKVIEPEAGKAGNWSTMLASLAALFGALAAWFYRRAGQIPRPVMVRADSDARWDSLLEKLEEINISLADTHLLAVATNEKVIRLEGRLDSLGRRLARMEGQQAGGD